MTEEQQRTPEDQRERAQYMASMPDRSQNMYDKDQSVWYKFPQGQRVAMKVVAFQEGATGTMLYQLKTSDGKMHDNGAWVEEGKLENNAH